MPYVMIIQKHRWGVGWAKDMGGTPNNPRPDEVCYDIENAQVYVINVRPLKNAVTHPKKENVL